MTVNSITTKDKKISGIIAILMISLGVWRWPTYDNRLFLDIFFQLICSLIIAYVIYCYVNKWVGLLVYLVFINSISFNSITYSTSFSTAGYLHILLGVAWYSLIVLFADEDQVFDAIAIIAICQLGFIICRRIGIPILQGQTNNNEYSALFALCFPAFLKKKWCKFLPVVLIGLCLARSTGGMLAVLISCLILFVFYFSWEKTIISICLLTIISIAYLRYIDTPTVDARLRVWKMCFEYFKKNTLLGYGIGSFRENNKWDMAFRHIDSNGKLWWQTANNEFCQGIYELGIGLILLIIGYVLSIVKLIKNNVLFLVIFVTIITISCCTYTLHNPLNALITISLLGIIEKQRRLENGNQL